MDNKTHSMILQFWGGGVEKGKIGKSLNVHRSGISKLTLANPYNELPSGCHKEQGQFWHVALEIL